MALIKCSECGKEISDKAEVCLHCGNPIQKTIKEEKKKQRKSFYELNKMEKREIIDIMKAEGEYYDVLITIATVWLWLNIIALCLIFGNWLLSGFSSNIWYIYGTGFCSIDLIISIIVLSLYGWSKAKKYYNNNVDIILVSKEQNDIKKKIKFSPKFITILLVSIAIIFISMITMFVISLFKKDLQYDTSYSNTQKTKDFTIISQYIFKDNEYYQFMEETTDNTSFLKEYNELKNNDNEENGDLFQALIKKYTTTIIKSGSYIVSDNEIYLMENDTKKEYTCFIIKDNEIQCNNVFYKTN